VTPADYTLRVVDDSDDNRYTLTRRLAREGYTRVVTANDGRQALDPLAAQPGRPRAARHHDARAERLRGASGTYQNRYCGVSA
jgi:CheY-like chemotaxis protein